MQFAFHWLQLYIFPKQKPFSPKMAIINGCFRHIQIINCLNHPTRDQIYIANRLPIETLVQCSVCWFQSFKCVQLTKICDYRYNRVSVSLEKVSSQSRRIMYSWLFRTRDQTLTSYRKNRMNTICPAPRRLGSFVVQSRLQRNRTGHGPSPWRARIYSLSRNEIL